MQKNHCLLDYWSKSIRENHKKCCQIKYKHFQWVHSKPSQNKWCLEISRSPRTASVIRRTSSSCPPAEQLQVSRESGPRAGDTGTKLYNAVAVRSVLSTRSLKTDTSYSPPGSFVTLSGLLLIDPASCPRWKLSVPAGVWHRANVDVIARDGGD